MNQCEHFRNSVLALVVAVVAAVAVTVKVVGMVVVQMNWVDARAEVTASRE